MPIVAIFLFIYSYASREIPSHSELPSCVENSSSGDSQIVIDFETCMPCKSVEYFELGSLHYRIEGKSENVCKLRYGMEVENPNWNGQLDNYCEVPISTGLSMFEENESELSETGSVISTGIGYNFEKIKEYCE